MEKNGVGTIKSDLKEQFCDSEGQAQIDALESFILALACEGYDISEPRFARAIQSSLDAIANNS